MSKQPLISICLLTYNHEEYISESIESVLAQEYENWEFIIVDNASTDNTRKIIESYARKDSRITFVPQERNLFVSKGINIAIEKAKGEYLALLSGDDTLYPQKLSRQFQYMQENNLDLSFTWITTIDNDSKPGAKNVQKWFNVPEVKNVYEILSYYFKFHNVTCSATAMIHENLLRKVALNDNRLLQTQDLEWWIRMMEVSQKVAILQETLTYYRVLNDGNNLSSNNTSTKRNRTDFEMLYVWKGLFELDNTVLSKVFNTSVTDDNKYHVLYSHFEKNDIYLGKIALMQYLFEKLGADADVSSSSFLFFFEKYGEVAFVDKILLDKKDSAVKCLEEQLENHKKTLMAKEESTTWLEEQLENHKKTLVEKEESTVWLEGQLENHKKTLVAKEEGIVWLENKLACAQKELHLKDEELRLYQNIVEKSDVEMLRLEEENVWFSQQLEEKEKNNLWLTQQLEEKEEIIRHLRHEVGCKKSFYRCLKKVIKKLIGRK